MVFKRKETQEKKPLNISLLATASGSISMALVKVDGDTKLVMVGTQIDGYRVSKIERNYIVLSKGQEEKAVGFSFSSTSKAAEEKLSTQTQTFQAVIQKRDIESVTADPGIMFRQIRLVPYVQEGKTTGFLFEWVDPQSMFSKVGIMPGDVLVSINNQSIKSGEDAFRILQVLRNESSFKINLIREGKSVELFVRVE
ncbi:type II secretion system protein GspC [Thermocrinis sp.]